MGGVFDFLIRIVRECQGIEKQAHSGGRLADCNRVVRACVNVKEIENRLTLEAGWLAEGQAEGG